MASNMRRCLKLRQLVGQVPPQQVLENLGLRAFATAERAAASSASRLPPAAQPSAPSARTAFSALQQPAFPSDGRRSATSAAVSSAADVPEPEVSSQTGAAAGGGHASGVSSGSGSGDASTAQAAHAAGSEAPPGLGGDDGAAGSAAGAGQGTAQGSGQGAAEGSASSTAGAEGGASSSGQEQQQAGGEGAGAGFGAAAEEAKRKAEEARQKAAGLASRLRGVLSAVAREVTDVILPQTESSSATRRRADGLRAAAGGGDGGGPAEVMVVEQPETVFQKRWRRLREQYGQSPLFQRLEALGAGLGDNAAVRKSREMREDLRERWETSDSPLVHRLQDMSDSMFAETEMARAFREVQVRDPSFDMVSFLRQLKADVPTIVGAYLKGQADVLKEHCAPPMVEQLTAIIKAQHTQGLFADPTLLDVSEVELADLKFLENDPVIVVQFHCQQINCTRDQFGNVVEGRPDDLQRVYYYWAIQQDAAGFVGTDGKHYPPRWQLREMLVRGMHALIG